MDGFNGILDTGKEEEVKMIRDKLVDGKGILVRMISEGGDSSNIRQVLLHWCFELK